MSSCFLGRRTQFATRFDPLFRYWPFLAHQVGALPLSTPTQFTPSFPTFCKRSEIKNYRYWLFFQYLKSDTPFKISANSGFFATFCQALPSSLFNPAICVKREAVLWLLLVGLLISIGEVLLRGLHLESLNIKHELTAVQRCFDRREVTNVGLPCVINHALSLLMLTRNDIEVGD